MISEVTVSSLYVRSFVQSHRKSTNYERVECEQRTDATPAGVKLVRFKSNCDERTFCIFRNFHYIHEVIPLLL
jgi:hypothetical protein